MENPAVLGSLIAAVPELAASFLPTAAELLEPYATDPRLAIAIATWAQDPPTSSTSTYPFWTRSLGYLAASQDTRAIALLERRIAKAPDAKSQFWPKFYRALTKTIDALASTTPGTIKVPKLALAKLVRSAATKPAKKPAAPKPAKATGPGLAGVASQIGNGDIAGAIDAMLDRWRATRVPELARLIERATTLLPAYDRPLGETDKAATAAWTAAYDEDPVANLPALLANLTTGGAREAESRLTMLGRVPDDPRISFHLATVCGTRDIGPQRTQFWRSTFELLARIADQRVAEMLRYSFDNFEGTYYDHHKQARRLIKPYVTAALEAPVPVFDRDDTKHAAAISAALDTAIAHDPARTILAAIAESPEDPGPVLVYADWLALRGHPRGEYLVLACKSPLDPSEIKRHAALRNVPCLFGPFGATGYKPHDTVHGLVRTAHVSYFTNGYLMRALADFPLMALVQALVSESMHTTVEDYAALVDASPKLASITLVSSTKITASTLAARLGSSWVAEGATVRRI